jgi:hypothetical protein
MRPGQGQEKSWVELVVHPNRKSPRAQAPGILKQGYGFCSREIITQALVNSSWYETLHQGAPRCHASEITNMSRILADLPIIKSIRSHLLRLSKPKTEPNGGKLQAHSCTKEWFGLQYFYRQLCLEYSAVA